MSDYRFELFNEWTTYEKVVAGDYMHHRQFFAELVDCCKRLSGPAHVLDLGCGDAVPVLPLLEQIPLASYTGVDPSPHALSLAADNLAHLAPPTTLIESTMEEAIDGLDGPFDLILMSFSLHHLPSAQKCRMLSSCRSRLSTRGIVAVIDVFRDDDEPRDRWLDRWEQDARDRFLVLEAVEIEQLVGHVRDNDLPETLAGFAELASAAGYGWCETVTRGREKLNGLVICAAGD